MKELHFQAMDIILEACKQENISPIDAASRWMMNHSGLSAEYGDGVIIGASTVEQFETIMASLAGGPLPQAILDAFDKAWPVCKPVTRDFGMCYIFMYYPYSYRS